MKLQAQQFVDKKEAPVLSIPAPEAPKPINLLDIQTKVVKASLDDL